MALLEDFLQGAADRFVVESEQRELAKKERIAIKEAMALRAQDKALRRREREEDRLHDILKEEQEKRSSVLDTFVSDDGVLTQVLGDGSKRPLRKQTAEERANALSTRNFRDAQTEAMRRPPAASGRGRATPAESRPVVVTDQLAMQVLGVLDEKELRDDPVKREIYMQIRGVSLTREQIDDLRARVSKRIQKRDTALKAQEQGGLLWNPPASLVGDLQKHPKGL